MERTIEVDLSEQREPEARRFITVPTKHGGVVVDADIYGPFAIHPYTNHPGDPEPIEGLTLCHTRTGLAMECVGYENGDAASARVYLVALIIALESLGFDWDWVQPKESDQNNLACAYSLIQAFPAVFDAVFGVAPGDSPLSRVP